MCILSTIGAPSIPVITAVTTLPGTVTFTLTLDYVGHNKSFYMDISVFANNTRGFPMFMRQQVAKASIITGGHLSNYSLPFVIPPGLYWFSVRAGNMFGSSKESDTYPPPGISAVEGNIGIAWNCIIVCLKLIELLILPTHPIVLPSSCTVPPPYLACPMPTACAGAMTEQAQ